MILIHKPMLAEKLKDLRGIKYPVLGSPKLDGVRALTIEELVSRNFKAIPNSYVRQTFSTLRNNMDGELITDNSTPAGAGFNVTQSDVMSESGSPDVLYHIFDYVKSSLHTPYYQRVDDLILSGASKNPRVKIIVPVDIVDEDELLEYEEECLAKNYEGVMLRDPMGPYKEGRSTVKEGYLVKLKRSDDSEAEVVGFEERMHNANEAEEDAFGHVKRSSAKAGLIPDGCLGKLYVRDIHNGVEFEIGTGFTQQMRDDIWTNRNKWMGKIVKYKFQSKGMKNKPRFPVFIGVSNEGKFVLTGGR